MSKTLVSKVASHPAGGEGFSTCPAYRKASCILTTAVIVMGTLSPSFSEAPDLIWVSSFTVLERGLKPHQHKVMQPVQPGLIMRNLAMVESGKAVPITPRMGGERAKAGSAPQSPSFEARGSAQGNAVTRST